MYDNEAVTRIREKAKDSLKYDLVYKIHGARGRSLRVYPYKCIINTSVTAGSLLTNNATDGEKTIYFNDVIGIQYKKSGVTIGYLQFETASGTMNHDKSNFFSENTFTFEADNDVIMEEVYEYIIGIFDEIKRSRTPIVVTADVFKDINTGKLNSLIEYNYRELVKNNPEYHDLQEILKDDVESLEKEVADALMQYNEVRSEANSLNDRISEDREHIEKLQGEITKLKSYGKSSSVSERIKLKETELAELETHYAGLLNEKKELTERLEQKKANHSKKFQMLKEKKAELRKN